MKTLYTLIFIAFAAISFAQNASEDFKKMNQYYLNKNHVAVDIKYLFYENHQSINAIDVQQAKYKKSGDNYYYAIDGLVTVQNNKYKLAMHNKDEIILVGVKKDEIDPGIFTGNKMDTILSLYKKIDYHKTASGKKKYTLNFQNSTLIQYSKVVVFLNDNYSLSKLIFYYKNPINYTADEEDVEEAPRFEIVYSNTSTKVIPTSQYSISKYIKINGKKISAVGKYANYRLINHLM